MHVRFLPTTQITVMEDCVQTWYRLGKMVTAGHSFVLKNSTLVLFIDLPLNILKIINFPVNLSTWGCLMASKKVNFSPIYVFIYMNEKVKVQTIVKSMFKGFYVLCGMKKRLWNTLTCSWWNRVYSFLQMSQGCVVKVSLDYLPYLWTC